jgi:hypothetical protein
MSLGGATVLFALLLGALVCAVEIAPQNQATSVAVSTNKEERLPVLVSSKCALETWPNITTDCLRNAGPGPRLGDARLIVAERQ